MIKRHVQYFAVAGLFAGLMSPASAQDTIKIGELNSYKAQPASRSLQEGLGDGD